MATLARKLPLVAVAGLVAYGVIVATGIGGALLVAAIGGLSIGVVTYVARSDQAARALVGRTATGAVLCVPAALTVFFSFSSGGFFPDAVAIGVLAVAVLLVVRIGLAEKPLAAVGRGALAPLAGIAGLSGWALLSQLWSHAPGRADVGFDRDVLYALTFALFATVGRTRERLAWALRLLAAGMVIVAGFALLSRVAPDVLPTAPVPQSGGRLAYPLTYWNALGIFSAVAGILCVHLSAGDERWLARVLGAAVVPMIGATLLLTYSRGGLAAAAIGLVVYAVFGRPRGLLPALLAIAPGTTIAVVSAYGDTLLSSPTPTTPAAVHQGHHLAVVVLACAALSAALRAALLVVDGRLEGGHSPIDSHRTAIRNVVIGSVAVAVGVVVALGAPGAISRRWDQFVHQQTVPAAPLLRARLSTSSNNGRLELWTIAIEAFDAHPLDGNGQDTFEILWYEHRQEATVVVNAHSLYIETLAELGIVGLALVALYVVGILVGVAPFGRGRDRALYAAIFAAGLAWTVHAGVDWDWQMPATSLWLPALGGLALGRPAWHRPGAARWTAIIPVLAGVAAVAAAVLPALVLASQVRLNEATTAYAQGDCRRADSLARASLDALATRAPPWQIEALCSVATRKYRIAAAQLRGGLAEDPDDWQLESALAAVTAAQGLDARAQASQALALDPLDPRVRALAQALRHGRSAQARRAALSFLSQQSLIESG